MAKTNLYRTYDTMMTEEGYDAAVESLQEIQGGLETILEAHPDEDEAKAARFLLKRVNDAISALNHRLEAMNPDKPGEGFDRNLKMPNPPHINGDS